MTIARFALILASVALNAVAQIVLRRAMLSLGALSMPTAPVTFLWSLTQNLYLWAGLACYGVSVLFWLAVLSKTQVSVAYPMLSIGYVIAAILGYLFLNETFGLMRIGGIALICMGVLLVARSS
jgi:drug/metabolite transporter (DMT)-like permease